MEAKPMRCPKAALGVLLLIIILGTGFPYAFAAPGTITTTTNYNSIEWVQQRRNFYGDTLYWQFWSDGTNMVYSSSSTGTSGWAGSTSVRVCALGECFSIWYDTVNNYVYYCYAAQANNNALYYCRGTPASNGVISWGTERTAVAAVSNGFYYLPFVSVDTSGYPYISYCLATTVYRATVTRSSTNDGTWTTAANFPYQLSTGTNYYSEILPFTSGKMIAIYSYSGGATIKAKEYDGSSTWGAEKATASNFNVNWCALTISDTCYMVYTQDSTYNIISASFSYAGNAWSAESSVQATGAIEPLSISQNSATGDLYCFWYSKPTLNHIYYKACKSGTWDTNPTDLGADGTIYTGNPTILATYTSNTAGIGFVYLQNSATPWNIRFNVISMVTSQTYTETSTKALSITRSSAIYATRVETSTKTLSITRVSSEFITRIESSIKAFSLIKSSTEYVTRVETSSKALSLVKSSAEYVTRVLTSTKAISLTKSSAEYVERIESSVKALALTKASSEYVTRVLGSTYAFSLAKSSAEYAERVLGSVYGFTLTKSSTEYIERILTSTYAFTFTKSSSNLNQYSVSNLYNFVFTESSSVNLEYLRSSVYSFAFTEISSILAEYSRISTYAFTFTESSLDSAERLVSSTYDFIFTESSGNLNEFIRSSTYAFTFTKSSLESIEVMIANSYNFILTLGDTQLMTPGFGGGGGGGGGGGAGGSGGRSHSTQYDLKIIRITVDSTFWRFIPYYTPYVHADLSIKNFGVDTETHIQYWITDSGGNQINEGTQSLLAPFAVTENLTVSMPEPQSSGNYTLNFQVDMPVQSYVISQGFVVGGAGSSSPVTISSPSPPPTLPNIKIDPMLLLIGAAFLIYFSTRKKHKRRRA